LIKGLKLRTDIPTDQSIQELFKALQKKLIEIRIAPKRVEERLPHTIIRTITVQGDNNTETSVKTIPVAYTALALVATMTEGTTSEVIHALINLGAETEAIQKMPLGEIIIEYTILGFVLAPEAEVRVNHDVIEALLDGGANPDPKQKQRSRSDGTIIEEKPILQLVKDPKIIEILKKYQPN